MPTRLEPLRPVLRRLALRMGKEYPNAVPFDDRQPWTWPVERAVPPGCWAFTVGANTEGQETTYAMLPDFTKVAGRVIHFEGPPRAFLAGWDTKVGEAVCVSSPVFYEVID